MVNNQVFYFANTMHKQNAQWLLHRFGGNPKCLNCWSTQFTPWSCHIVTVIFHVVCLVRFLYFLHRTVHETNPVPDNLKVWTITISKYSISFIVHYFVVLLCCVTYFEIFHFFVSWAMSPFEKNPFGGFQLHFVHLPFAEADFSNSIALMIEIKSLAGTGKTPEQSEKLR